MSQRVRGLHGLACPTGVVSQRTTIPSNPHQPVQLYHAKGCFKEHLKLVRAGRARIELLADHSWGRRLASTADGTLRVWESDVGLMWATAADVPAVVAAAAQRPEWKCSFGGTMGADSETRTLSDGVELIYASNALVFEVSILTRPLFPETWARPLYAPWTDFYLPPEE